MPTHQEQFQSIHAMLASGHRSVRLEKHSLLLLGGVGGFLSVATEWVITETHFPDLTERSFALLLWLAFWLGGSSLLEHWLTRRAAARQAETLPFAQAQITRAWWMLLSVGSLGSYAMQFHGGGDMIYALWAVLLGLGIYLFGLFSRLLIEWIGLATILLGILGLAGLPFGATRWLTASAFIIGLPLAGWLNARVTDSRFTQRMLALVLWLTLVITPPLLITRFSHTPIPTGAPTALNSEIGTGKRVLRPEAGTRVPLRVNLKSALVDISAHADLPMTLSVPMEIALKDGKPDGRYRMGNGAWHNIHDGALQIRIYRLSPGLEGNQPVVRAEAEFGGGQP